MNIYDYEVIGSNGEKVSLSQYKGKILLIVNTATECGFTPQYEELEQLHKEFGKDGLVIMDFPCNQFGNQAPGTRDEIESFCQLKYGVSYPIFEKIEVNGSNAAPLYQYLVGEKGFAGFDPDHNLTPILEELLGKANPNFKDLPDIKWNFTKFLVDRNGKVVERFEPTTSIEIVREKIKELV